MSALALAAVFTAGVTAAGAQAAANSIGTVTATVNVAVRSLSVSPTSTTFCSPSFPLTFPNGQCSSSNITISNGPVGGHIDVNGADALPSDANGNSWTLCLPDSSCTGPSAGAGHLAGIDQYYEQTVSGIWGSPFLSAVPQCDTVFDLPSGSGCTSAPGQTSTEYLQLYGPSTSNDQSSTFSTSITWTAAP